MPLGLAIDPHELSEVCRRFHVACLELFGSRAKGTARADSDVDLLVTFEPDFSPGLEFFGLADELERLFGRRVDLLTRARIERDRNDLFRRSVLSNTETIYGTR